MGYAPRPTKVLTKFFFLWPTNDGTALVIALSVLLSRMSYLWNLACDFVALKATQQVLEGPLELREKSELRELILLGSFPCLIEMRGGM
jgi:hypothetical protein